MDIKKFDEAVANRTSGWHKKSDDRILNEKWQDIAFEMAILVASMKIPSITRYLKNFYKNKP